MPTFAPLFVTGPARSGTTLVALLLSAHRDVMVASDPYLTLFRSLRNAIMRDQPPATVQQFDPSSPLQDYYFTDARIALMDAILRSDLRVRFDPDEWDTFLERSVARGGVMAPDLASHFGRLRGDDYRTVFSRALEIVADVRDAGGRRWVGFKDVWIIEFFSAIAASFPDARFVVVLRDPRAIMASMLAIEDSSQVAHPLSYARHWRKHVALIEHYRQDPRLAGRLHVLRLEDLVSDPETEARRLCAFLDVAFEPAMLDSRNYFDYATGAVWAGNSSFERRTAGFNRTLADVWRTHLASRVRQLTDLVCAPEMELAGYRPDPPSASDDRDVLEYLLDTARDPVNWRSDLGDLQQDYSFELFRRALVALPPGAARPDEPTLRRSFLFTEVYARLRGAEARVVHA
jgi:hypothetical protein